MEQTCNTVTLRGILAQAPVYSHENHGRKFYRFFLEVSRLSGAVDRLPVVAEQSLLTAHRLCAGCCLTVSGQIRSHNRREDGIRRLLVFVFAGQLQPEEGPCLNDVAVEGVLCREPTYRRTPLGRQICDVMLAVPRAFHRADYLPCILWGAVAQEAAACHTGDRIRVLGRMQSRQYTKLTEEGQQSRTAYEISALSAQIPV